MKEPFIVSEDNLRDVARRVVNTLAGARTGKAKVLFLEGDLGAGKTTFTKAIASILGIPEEEVHSPTFILKKEYKGDHDHFRKLVHVDAYRFDTPEEAKILKLHDDHNEEGTLLVIEWPEKLGGSLDEDMSITLSVIDDTTREMVINYADTY